MPAGGGTAAGAGSGSTLSSRARAWAATMEGHVGPGGVRFAHRDAAARVVPAGLWDREAREAAEAASLVPGATASVGAGRRLIEEEPDPWRTCFERDRDRILHSASFRRLAGKTQVFVFPADHQRTRLTHALEVAQVATAIARACRLNVTLTEAIALGHDCGHGPGGHASEDALSPFVAGGFDHAVWGADFTAAPLNLCAETLDGIRNHSWSRPAPATAEGEVVSLADRIAYTAHDLEDAVHAGVVREEDLPATVAERCGSTRASQLRLFITDVVETTLSHGAVGMSEATAEAMADLRRFNYERIYLRQESLEQSRRVVDMLEALVEHYLVRPAELPEGYVVLPATAGTEVERAVSYVAGMTDRFACAQAMARLGWPADRLPRGFDAG
jgi:dGTPase